MPNMLAAEFESPASGMKALLYSPAALSLAASNRVILYLHGLGGFGTGLAGLYQFPDLPSLLRDGMQVSCAVIIPSCHVGEYWQPRVIGAFLDDFERSYGPTEMKYDVIGYSRGGTGAFIFAASAPERIRTLVAISARSALDVIDRITEIPTLLCHGTMDTQVAAEESRLMRQHLCAAGGACDLMLIEGGHFIVAEVLSNDSVFAWQRTVV
jgi:poly(3-hydroxybutyrate) depolymerase